MSLAFVIYLIDAMSSVKILSWFAFAFSLIFTVINFCCACSETEKRDYEERESYKSYMQMMKRGAWSVAIVALFITFVPDKKTSYTIFAAHVAQKMYESPESAKLQGKVLTILNKKLDEYIDEQPNKETK